MTFAALAALFAASAINTAIPGPCVFHTLGRTASQGWTAGLGVTLGIAFADTLLVIVSCCVILGTIAISATAFTVMKWAGVGALLLLAAMSLRSPAPAKAQAAGSVAWTRRHTGDFASGLMVGLSSPYNLIFLLALLPQYLPAQDLSAATGLTVIAVVTGAAALVQAGIVLLGATSGRLAPGLWFSRAGAAAMLGFAALAATSSLA